MSYVEIGELGQPNKVKSLWVQSRRPNGSAEDAPVGMLLTSEGEDYRERGGTVQVELDAEHIERIAFALLTEPYLGPAREELARRLRERLSATPLPPQNTKERVVA